MAPKNRNVILQTAAIIIVIAIAGPELTLGLEAFTLLHLLGAEALLLSLFAGIRLLPIWHSLAPIIRWIEKYDPYFFFPDGSQIRNCPGIIFHAVPGLVATCFAIAAWGVL